MAITITQAKEKKFAELVLWAKQALPDTEIPEAAELGDHAKLTQYMVQNHGQVKKSSLIATLETFGLVVSDSGAAAEPQEPQVQEQVAEEPTHEEEYTEDDTGLDAQMGDAMSRDSDPTPADPVADEPYKPPFKLMRDDKNRIRTEDGKFVCALCIRDKVDSPYVADKPNGLGPHAKSHADKGERGWLTGWIPVLPLLQEEPAPAAKEPSKAEQSAAATAAVKEGTHSTLPPSSDPVAQNEEEAASAMLDQMQGDLLQSIDARLTQFEQKVMTRLDALETTLANAMITTMVLDDQARQALFQKFSADKVGVLSDILKRQV